MLGDGAREDADVRDLCDSYSTGKFARMQERVESFCVVDDAIVE
jgi:hypothetical protein